jgi:hypothetical protein
MDFKLYVCCAFIHVSDQNGNIAYAGAELLGERVEYILDYFGEAFTLHSFFLASTNETRAADAAPQRFSSCRKVYDAFARSVLRLNTASLAYSFLVCSLK